MPSSARTYRPVRAADKVSRHSKVRKNFLSQDREAALHWRAFGSVAVLAVLILAAWLWMASSTPEEDIPQSAVVEVSMHGK